jgi:hypothetical protein
MRPVPTEPMLENCATCGRETRHEPDRDGVYHCTACPERERNAKLPERNRATVLVVAIVGGMLAIALILWLVQR